MDRCCIFIDGENLRHTITKLFEGSFHPAEYLPKRAHWQEFFDSLAEIRGARRLRAYWYVLAGIDFYPYAFPHMAKGLDEIRRMRRLLEGYPPNKPMLAGLEGMPLVEKLGSLAADLEAEREKMRKRFEGWTTVQNGIAQRHSAVEFRRAGGIRYDLFRRRLGSEKAVDVKLGIDLLLLKDIYDTAVIVSGDQDYVPAVQAIQDAGKKVLNVAFKTRNGDLLPGGARRLNIQTDDTITVPFADFAKALSIVPK